MNNDFYKYIAGILGIFFVLSPVSVLAATSLEVSGWIPYWRTSEGVADARTHLNELTSIHPFGFSVKEDGSLADLSELTKSTWQKLFKSAKSKNVEIIPTVMWSDAANMQKILSDKDDREDHIDAIVKMVKKGKYAGVDIDYEGKWAETKDYYSMFLKELKKKLGSKELSCTIEARTPPDSLYTVIPPTLQYANDYVEINKYCDRVNIMAYDQGRADLKLNAAKIGAPYVPVADIDWVRKVIEFTSKTISKNKIFLGVATYGYEYEITVSPNWFQGYRRLWSVGPSYAENVANEHDITPSRNRAGEMSFTYQPSTALFKFPALSIPKDTPTGNITSARALAFANATRQTVSFNLAWWSDAQAIEQKVDLARELGLRGVALFKIDGAEDPDLWEIFE